MNQTGGPRDEPGLDRRRRRRDRLRARARSVVARLLARPLLRGVIGRWPTGAEASLFGDAFGQPFAAAPPIIRALASVPAARPQLTRAMLQAWMAADPAYRDQMLDGLDSRAVRGRGDVLSVWRGPPIAFMHLEETAGMSISAMLEAEFHPTQISAIRQPGGIETQARRSALITGHFDLPSLRRIDPERFALTFLREPRGRILSLYYDWRSYDPSFAEVTPGVRNAAALPLLDWLRDETPDVRNAIDNHYARRLLGFYRDAVGGDGLAADAARVLISARAALDSLGFIGVTEHMEQSLHALQGMLPFERPAVVQRLNVSAQNEAGASPVFRPVRREPITSEINAELAKLTRLDSLLYDQACAELGIRPNYDLGSNAHELDGRVAERL